MTKMRLAHQSHGRVLDQFWFNPKDGKVYTTLKEPEHGFTTEISSHAIYDAAIGSNNHKIIQEASVNGTLTQNLVDALPSASLDGDLTADMNEFDSNLLNHRIREAAMISTDNPAVNVVRIYSQLYGLKDRAYPGTELSRRVATEELILNFDKVIKMEGLEEIAEMTMPRASAIKYERQLLETKKYGLWIRISDESIRKNVHNPFQDSVTVAGNKVNQRKSFDVISSLVNELSTVPGTAWDTYVSGTDRSTNDPTIDIARIVTQSIEGTNVGGKWDRFGIHQIGGKLYDTNSYLRGIIAPVDTAVITPGTRSMKGFNDVTMVNDQFIPQGVALLTDVGTEATAILLEGPTQIATKTDEYLQTQNYVIIDHHVATVLNSITGVQMTGVYTPLAPPS